MPTPPVNEPRLATTSFMENMKVELPNPTLSAKEEKVLAPVETPPEKSDEKKIEPEPELKPETKPEEKVEPPKEEEKWPRTAKDWDAFKAKRKEVEIRLQGELQTASSKLKESEDKLAKVSNPNIEENEIFKLTKKERDELSEQLRMVSVENHPKFKAYFDNRINSQIGLAQKIVGTELAEKAKTILLMPDGEYKDSQIEQLTQDLTPLQQSRLGGVLNSLSEINNEKQSEIANARANLSKIQEQNQSQQKQRLTELEGVMNSVLSKAQDPKSGIALFQTKEGDDNWNNGVKSRLETARAIFSGQLKPEQVALAARDAAAFPVVLEYTKHLQSELTKRDEQIKSLSAASPSVQSNEKADKSTDSQQPVKIKAHSNPMDAARSFAQVLQADLRGS